MKVKSGILQLMHLDQTYSMLAGKNVKILHEYFTLLDIHDENSLNGKQVNENRNFLFRSGRTTKSTDMWSTVDVLCQYIQFNQFMHSCTDMNTAHIYKVFDMLDVDGSGKIDFDEFYLLACILVSLKDNEEKQFIYRHSRTVFELLDEDGSQSISASEFSAFGFLFNFHGDAVKQIFNDFDISGDQELDYKEFKMFAMACIDRQNDIDRRKRDRLDRDRKKQEEKKQKKEERRLIREEIQQNWMSWDTVRNGCSVM